MLFEVQLKFKIEVQNLKYIILLIFRFKMDKIKIQKQLFGQLVIGPPGAGKTTYCQKMLEFYAQLGRKVFMINLDPANENMSFTPEIDIMDLITLEDVMEHYVRMIK